MYWDAIRHFKRFQGGFVWDFVDKAIQVEEDGVKKLCYGGAFEEKIRDYSTDMCLNGVVFADLEVKLGTEEIKNLQAPIVLKYDSWHGLEGCYRLYNEYLDSDCADLEFSWELVCNGSLVEKGVYEGLTIAPGGISSCSCHIPKKRHMERPSLTIISKNSPILCR